MRLVAAGDTDRGRVRPDNEDAVYVGRTLFAVADGMGGAAGGRVASTTSLEPMAALDGASFDGAAATGRALQEAISEANAAIREAVRRDRRLDGMGTTLTAALFDRDRLHIGHVGDSRAYLLRDGELRQMTRDHSLVQELVDLGALTPEQAEDHPQSAVITRAVGLSDELRADLVELRPREGDRFLLCSDGLSGVLEDDTLRDCLLRSGQPQSLVTSLVEHANARGGPDNISVVVVDVAADVDARG